MSLEDFRKEKLWPVLVETVHATATYPNHKAYTRNVILQERPETTPQELAARLGMPLGEALVVMYELAVEGKAKL
jgi:hypothetical protein